MIRDVEVVEKDNKTTVLVDIALSGNTRVEEQEKLDKYQSLARELKGLWKAHCW